MSSTSLTKWTQDSMGKVLAKTVARCLSNEDNRRDFELWYEKTYGKKYIWKKESA